MIIKRHLLTIRTRAQVHAFWVWATTGADGKTRVSRATMNACMEAAGAHRGECVCIG